MIRTDSHMHTSFSTDSKVSPESMLEEAVKRGLQSICITDHMDFDYPDGGFIFDPDAYFEKMLALKHLYQTRLNVRIGVEIGLQPHLNDQIHELIDVYPFDFVIGSVHLVDGQDPYYRDRFDCSDGDLYERYFRYMLECLKYTDGYQTLGHMDYVVRYGYAQESEYQFERYESIIEEILELMIAKGIALEVNTAGLKYGLSEPNPRSEIISRYLSLGGEMITIGADAHKPDYISFAFDQVLDKLKGLGVKSITEFTERKPTFIKL